MVACCHGCLAVSTAAEHPCFCASKYTEERGVVEPFGYTKGGYSSVVSHPLMGSPASLKQRAGLLSFGKDCRATQLRFVGTGLGFFCWKHRRMGSQGPASYIPQGGLGGSATRRAFSCLGNNRRLDVVGSQVTHGIRTARILSELERRQLAPLP